MAELIEWERRQGMRARGGWVWSTWQPCGPDEALRVAGLHSWQVRRVCVCTTCGGTGRMPDGVSLPRQEVSGQNHQGVDASGFGEGVGRG